MANPITVFNTDILTTISSVEYNGASGVNVDNENRIISLDENTLSAVSSVDNKLDISSYHEYSAGNNIDITNYEISGKDWTSDISNASSYAYSQATAQIPSEFDPTYMSGQIDNKLDKSDFDTYSGVVDNQITALRHDLGTVSTNTGYLYNDLTSTSAGLSGAVDYLSSHAGKTYEGVLPISVDNTNNEISISSTPFSVQEPLYFVENSNSSVVVGFSGDTFTGARVNIPLTGDGTTENPLGLMSYISWGGNGTTSTFTRSGVRVLDENNNSAYYLASGLNLNNESITDSAISSWNDTRTTVESNSASWGAGSVSLPITGSSNNTTANYDSNSAMFDYSESQGEPTHNKITINPDPNEGYITIYNSSDEDETNSTITITDSNIQFKDTGDNYYEVSPSTIENWDDTYNTVQSNSSNWGGITSVDTNHGISGNGTTSTPIGIASSFQLENPSVYTTATYKGDSIGIEGLYPRIQLKTDNSSYNTLGEGGMTITHSASGVGGGYTTSHYGSTMRLSYNDGDYYLHTIDTTKSGLGVAYKASPNVKAYYNYSGVALTNDNGATNEYVNVSSIRNWNDVYDTVSSNSASWTGGGGSVDTIPFVVQSPLTTGFTGDSAYIGIDSTAINLSSYVPYSALTTSYASRMITNINGSSLYVNSARNAYNAQTAQRSYGDRNGNEITSYYQPKLTIGGENNTITSINSSAIGSTNTATWELVEGTNISIVDDVATSSTTISVSGISANEWNDVYDTVSSNSSNWGGGGSVGDYLTATDTSSISYFKFGNNLQVSPSESYKGATISGYGLGDNEEAGNFVLNGRVLGLSSRGRYGWGANNVGVVFTPWHISGDNYVLSSDGLKFSWYDSTIQDMNTWKAVTANTAGVASANDFVTDNGVSLSSLNSATEWNETYNAVNTNSGTWGGSALNISAGNGVKVELVDNTLVFSNDETVLWSGTASPSNFPLTMSEPFSAFEKIEFVWDTRYDGDYGTPTKGTIVYTDNHGSTVPTKYTLVEAYANASQTWWDWWYLENDNNGTTLSNLKAIYYPMTGGNSASQSNCRLFKVVGINRKQV